MLSLVVVRPSRDSTPSLTGLEIVHAVPSVAGYAKADTIAEDRPS